MDRTSNNEPDPDIETARESGEEVEINLDDDPAPPDEADGSENAPVGLYVTFALIGGRTLELHVPQATGIEMAGDSNATALSYLLINADLSIEASGLMILEGAQNLIEGEGR